MIGIFVDARYMYSAAKGYINYTEMRRRIESRLGDKVSEAYYFSASVDGRPPPRNLTLPFPKGPGFRTKMYWTRKDVMYWPSHMGGKEVVHPDTGEVYERTTQKAVDVGLVYTMMKSYQRCSWDRLVLMAGDADFHEPVQDLVERGVDLYIVGDLRSISQELIPYATEVLELAAEPISGCITPKDG